jgi:hypothetical protein
MPGLNPALIAIQLPSFFLSCPEMPLERIGRALFLSLGTPAFSFE